MKKHLRKAVIAQFESQLAALEPPFSRLEAREPDGSEVCYGRPLGEGRYGFVMVLFSPRGQDKFTVELAYSTEPTFPSHIMPDLPIDFPNKQLTRGKEIAGAFRFCVGFMLRSRRDLWFEVYHPFAAESIVRDIVKFIEDVGIPMLIDGFSDR